jgi:hypothetical protein
VLPQSFLVWRGAKPGVFVNDAGRAKWREITPGLRGGQQLAIQQGLSAGEQVIRPAAGQTTALTDGQRIAVP